MEKIDLKNLNIIELEKLIERIEQPKYRAKQIFEWIYKGIHSFDNMTNLPNDLKCKLNDIAYISSLQIVKRFDSKIDGTKKYLLQLEDGNIIESVLMDYKHGLSICISSQVGCRMGCSFCASTQNGLVRSLKPAEILNQILTVSNNVGERISNVVIMGIGEPLDNYENIVKFLELVNSKIGLNIGYRHITLSTCGLVPQILKLSELNIPITLAISLHAPNDELRKQIMPIAKKYTINDIINACRTYIDRTNRRITFEYSLIQGVNDSTANAKELAKLLQNLLCHVNLIPVNEISENNYKKSNVANIKEFQKILTNNGIETTIRRELGKDINASCGQLRNTFI